MKIVVIVATDETHPVMPRGKWQHGLLVPVASPNILSQKPFLSQLNGPVVSRKRIVRSSASAEPALTAGGFEHGEFAQAILCEIRDLWFSVCNWERHVSSCPIILVFDARLAYSCLEKWDSSSRSPAGSWFVVFERNVARWILLFTMPLPSWAHSMLLIDWLQTEEMVFLNRIFKHLNGFENVFAQQYQGTYRQKLRIPTRLSWKDTCIAVVHSPSATALWCLSSF